MSEDIMRNPAPVEEITRNWLHVSGDDECFIPYTRVPKIKEIISVVSEIFSVSENDIRSERRKHVLCCARFAVCFLSRELTTKSFPAIGTFIGGRDHTTVMHAVRRAEELLTSSPDFAEKLATCRVFIRQRYMDV